MNKCKIDGCDKEKLSLGLCGMHYARLRKHGDPGVSYQLNKSKDEIKICKINGCTKKSRSNDLCPMHLARIKRHGEAGSASPNKRANGEGNITKAGYHYICCKDHPNAYENGKIAVHTLIMSQLIGRPLMDGESVHHKNGIKSDNSPENLELRTSLHPSGQKVNEMIDFCKMYLSLYDPDSLRKDIMMP